MKRFRMILAGFLLAALISGPWLRTWAAEDARASLTLMVYMCGSNLESRGGAGSRDLMEMASSGYDPEEVNLLVMTGGSKRWALGQPKDSICIYTPEGNTLRMVDAFASASMGDPATLASLLDYGYANYPADRYALILWDHGGGPMNGVCLDELYDSDTLTMEELYAALAASPAAGTPLEWIGFDACLMGSAEVASLMRPFARYMVASEETEPGGGWDYSFLAGIEADGDGSDTGRRIIDKYFENSQDGFILTLSCVDLAKLDALEAAMNDMFSSLEISSGNYALFSYAAGNTRSFGKAADSGYSYDLIDLAALVGTLGTQGEEAAEKTMAALEDCVVYARSSESAGGLSVYHPFDNKTDYVEVWSSLYPALGFAPGYADYIARFSSYLFGASDVSWQDLSALHTEDPSVYALPLSEGQADSVSGAVMHVLRWNEADGTYADLCTINQISLEEQVLYGADPGSSLAAVGDGGEPLTGAIPYDLLPEGVIGVYVNYCMEGAEQSGEASSLIAVDTGGFRRDFGSYTFDIDEAGTSGLDADSDVSSAGSAGSGVSAEDIETAGTQSLSELIAATPLTAEHISPLSGNLSSETLAVPVTVSLDTSASPVSVSAGASLIHASSGQGAAAITPLSSTGLGASVSSDFVMSSRGSSVDLEALTPVGVESFSPDQQVIDLSRWEEPSPEEMQLSAVVHAWLKCSVDGDGGVSVLETWLYDEESGLWSTRNTLDPALYPSAAFPVSWKLPTTEDGALTGYDAWKALYTTASVIPADAFRLRFVPAPAEENRCVSFQITDIQNRTYSSIPLLA